MGIRAFEDHTQWTAVKDVVSRLRDNGHEAFLAGGCVRDLLLGRSPNDFDIATRARPDEIEALFPNSIGVGRAFGVIIVPFADFQIEVATFREDLEYRDGRRPEGIRFATAEADACRRDFTINALFYDIERAEVIDFVGGREDLDRHIIRTVGDPDERFNEDKLRLLRAVRFSAQMDFEIEPATRAAIERRAHEVISVSRERIRDEVLKLLKQPQRIRGLKLLLETGLLHAIAPELALRLGRERWLEIFVRAPLEPLLSMALFLAPAYVPGQEREFRERYLRGLKLDNKMADAILFCLQKQNIFLDPMSVRRGELLLLLARPEAALAEDFARVVSGQKDLDFSETKREVFGSSGAPPKVFVSGDDATAAGIPKGPGMGQILNEIYLLQLEGSIQNRAEALDTLRRLARNRKN